MTAETDHHVSAAVLDTDPGQDVLVRRPPTPRTTTRRPNLPLPWARTRARTRRTRTPSLPTTRPRVSALDAAAGAEALRTMAAIVRTVFGVALQAPPAEQSAAQPVDVSMDQAPANDYSLGVEELPSEPLHVETIRAESSYVDVPAAAGLSVEPPVVTAPGRTLYAVPAIHPTDGEPIALEAPHEETTATPLTTSAASIGIPEAPALGIPVPAYTPPDSPTPASERHSLALLQEIAFLYD